MGGMRNNQGGRQPGNDEPGPAELQQQQHQNNKENVSDEDVKDLTSSEVDEARLKANRPQSDCRDDEEPGDL